MPRYKPYDYNQLKMIPVLYENQILKGSFEYALNFIIDNKLDLSIFDNRYENDETGAPAFEPAILLKIILFAYSRGIIHSRPIAKCCEENIVFMALSADTRPHFTTIANFISTMSTEISDLFKDVLLICDELNLIGKNMFAIDGCKLPTNASKEWSGTRKDFKRKKEKFEKAIRYIIHKHKSNDENDEYIPENAKKQIKSFENRIDKIKKWLNSSNDKIGKAGTPIKSNITDNDSAKMKTSNGTIQGYVGTAAADTKHQVIVHAEAFGDAQEHSLLEPMVDGIQENFKSIKDENVFEKTKLTADNGFHSEKNLEMLESKKIDAYLPDNLFRKRDPRFKTARRHKALVKKSKLRKNGKFKVSDFTYNSKTEECICPAGKRMHRQGKEVIVKGYRAIRFRCHLTDCRVCHLKKQCLKNPNVQRQVNFFDHKGKVNTGKESFSKKMIRKLDTQRGRATYSKRMGTIEPVFANMRSTIGLNRFTLRGKKKVNTQWLLYCIVHNLGKIQKYGLSYT